MQTVSTSVKTRRALVVALAASSALVLAGPAPGQARQQVIAMNSMSYGPMPSGLRVGDTVVFVNHDTVAHTATARDHSFDLRVPPGKTAQLVLQKPGAIPFYCIYHAPMRGVLNVAAR